MARNKGDFTLSNNFEVKLAGALDPRTLVSTKAELIQKDTWPYDGDVLYLYNGLLVSVADEQAIYMLVDRSKALDPTYAGWVKQSFDPTEIEDTTIVDNLTSTSATDALSANQGKVLNDTINSIEIAEADTASGAFKSYKLTLNGTQKGVTIDIPKDLVVSSGSVETVTEADTPYAGAVIGDLYLKLTIANGSDLYIPVKKLVDIYTAGDYIDITNNVVSIKTDEFTAKIKTDLSIPDNLSDTIDALSAFDKEVEAHIVSIEEILSTENTGLIDRVEAIEGSVESLGTSVSSLSEDVSEISEILNGNDTDPGLVSDVDTIKDTISDYSTVKSDVSTLKSDVTSLDDRLGDVEDSVASINEILDSKLESVIAGVGISINDTDAVNPTVSVKTVTKGGISATTEGLSVNAKDLAEENGNIDVNDEGKLILTWLSFN